MQDHSEPLGTLRRRRQLEPGPRPPDVLLGAADALGHGRLGNQKRSRDLRGAQAADRPQRQRELRRGRQRGMAAQEQQHEGVIPVGVGQVGVVEVGGRRVVGGVERRHGLAAAPRALGPPPVDQ